MGKKTIYKQSYEGSFLLTLPYVGPLLKFALDPSQPDALNKLRQAADHFQDHLKCGVKGVIFQAHPDRFTHGDREQNEAATLFYQNREAFLVMLGDPKKHFQLLDSKKKTILRLMQVK